LKTVENWQDGVMTETEADTDRTTEIGTIGVKPKDNR